MRIIIEWFKDLDTWKEIYIVVVATGIISILVISIKYLPRLLKWILKLFNWVLKFFKRILKIKPERKWRRVVKNGLVEIEWYEE